MLPREYFHFNRFFLEVFNDICFTQSFISKNAVSIGLPHCSKHKIFYLITYFARVWCILGSFFFLKELFLKVSAHMFIYCILCMFLHSRINSRRSEERRVGKECRTRWYRYH